MQTSDRRPKAGLRKWQTRGHFHASPGAPSAHEKLLRKWNSSKPLAALAHGIVSGATTAGSGPGCCISKRLSPADPSCSENTPRHQPATLWAEIQDKFRAWTHVRSLRSRLRFLHCGPRGILPFPASGCVPGEGEAVRKDFAFRASCAAVFAFLRYCPNVDGPLGR